MSTKSGFIERDGFKLGYTIEGSGTPTLVIGSAIYYPRTFSQNLRNHLQLIFIDHRGFVPSPVGQENKTFGLDILLSDIEYIRQKLQLDKFIIVGHSGHGYMSLEYAKKYPDHVSHVVLIGMGPNQSKESHQEADRYFNDSVCPERKAFLEENLKQLPKEIASNPDQRFKTVLLRFGARSWYDFRYDATPLWKDVYVNMPVLDYVWGTVFRDINISHGLQTFNKPVFLVLGLHDYLVAPFYSWYPLKSQFKNLTMKILQKSGHTPQLEESELFDKELLEWLSKNKF